MSTTSRSRWPRTSHRRRGKYYETAGALRDIFQNHLLQLLSIAAMEAPPNFDADSVRDEKVKVLKSIHPIDVAKTSSAASTAQAGWAASRCRLPAGANVSPQSTTRPLSRSGSR